MPKLQNILLNAPKHDHNISQDPGKLKDTNIRMERDLFICHASEDKNEVARPLAEALRTKGLKVWYDEFTLTLGDSLDESIDNGLV